MERTGDVAVGAACEARVDACAESRGAFFAVLASTAGYVANSMG